MMDRLRRLDERSSLAQFQRDQTALTAPLMVLIALAAVIGSPFAFASGTLGLGVFLLVVAIISGLFAWAGFRLRRSYRR